MIIVTFLVLETPTRQGSLGGPGRQNLVSQKVIIGPAVNEGALIKRGNDTAEKNIDPFLKGWNLLSVDIERPLGWVQFKLLYNCCPFAV